MEDNRDYIISNNNINDITAAKELKNKVNKYTADLRDFSLSPVPQNLGTIEELYREYRNIELTAKEIVKQLDTTANQAIEDNSSKSDVDIALSQLRTNRGYLTSNIRKCSTEGRELLSSEIKRFDALVEERNKAYDKALTDLVEDLKLGKLDLRLAIEKIDEEYEKQEIENSQILNPYVSALNSIRDQIDLEGLAIHSLNESSKWKAEAERLNGLAQLGITVEIIGHEIEGSI